MPPVTRGWWGTAPWQTDGDTRPALPVALDLASLYEQLLRQHLPVPARAGETLRDQLDRLAAPAAKQATIARLEARLNAEKQFNRKVALNAELRDLQKIAMALCQ